MKKAFTIFLILIALGGAGYGVKLFIDKKSEEKRIAKIKEGWYIEIITDFINIREEPYRYSYSPGMVKKGEVFAALDYDLGDGNLYWYKIKTKDGITGWVANSTSGTYLIDHNNPVDVATPIIKFQEDEYHVININSIKYDHLEAWDDKDDYEITHTIYHEVDDVKHINQYWIKYTITDKSGKHSSKTQKIVFEEIPDESAVTPFTEYTRD